MTVLRKIFGTSIAIAVALTVSEPPSAFAQAGGAAPAAAAPDGPAARAGGGGRAGGRGGRGGAGLYTPAAGAKDLKAVLFNWGWYMGMLRSSEARGPAHVAREYQGKGTIQVDGQPCNVTKWQNQHQLPDVRRADSVHGHPAQWPGVLNVRSPQRSVYGERRHSRCRTRR